MSTTSASTENYCVSRFQTIRRKTRVVNVGRVPVGGNHPIVVQSMTTTPTLDVDATVKQCIALAESGCDVVRITAQNIKAAEALGSIRRKFSESGFKEIPLVADIHFLPKAAMEAAKHVEKVRINPGNYADKKKFLTREYSDLEYNAELDRLHEAFSPLVLRCKELGRAMRIGTNHGSLSDRIMNRYGDSPLGMCESALEFIRVAESHGFHDIILSMKASNPKVMMQAYRLMVKKMAEEGMHYPLHLGVTEAGDGDDARIKSSIGIGSLLYDGLGDTIRVSLTEDPVYEVPVARDLARKVMQRWESTPQRTHPDPIDPYEFRRRDVAQIHLSNEIKTGPIEPPYVIQPYDLPENSTELKTWTIRLSQLQTKLKDGPIEGLLLRPGKQHIAFLEDLRNSVGNLVKFVVWDSRDIPAPETTHLTPGINAGDVILTNQTQLPAWSTVSTVAKSKYAAVAIATSPEDLAAHSDHIFADPDLPRIVTLDDSLTSSFHTLGLYRQLAEVLHEISQPAPIWIRNNPSSLIEPANKFFSDRLLEASMLSGALICDGIGDFISIETVDNPDQSTVLAYNILQGSRARTTRTEFVACPSCGRTLFDLQKTTQRIREATGHLNGVTIAVMGCIVNGPGEMADADFGYVGGAPGKINLYVGKECVRYHIPADEAVDALIDLIKEHGKWQDP